jgi:hypothetical protein
VYAFSAHVLGPPVVRLQPLAADIKRILQQA